MDKMKGKSWFTIILKNEKWIIFNKKKGRLVTITMIKTKQTLEAKKLNEMNIDKET